MLQNQYLFKDSYFLSRAGPETKTKSFLKLIKLQNLIKGLGRSLHQKKATGFVNVIGFVASEYWDPSSGSIAWYSDSYEVYTALEIRITHLDIDISH